MSLSRVLEDLEPLTQTIPWEGKKYQLREPSEGAMDKFVTTQAQSKGDRVESLDSEIVLVANSLYLLDEAENPVLNKAGKRQIIDINLVREMPARLVKGMFTWLVEAATRHRDATLEELLDQKEALEAKIKERQDNPGGN